MIGSPPPCGSNANPPSRRSNSSSTKAASAGGNATSPRIEVTTMFQVKIGRRHIVMPGARIRNVVVMTLTPDSRVEIATSASPRINRSGPTPGE